MALDNAVTSHHATERSWGDRSPLPHGDVRGSSQVCHKNGVSLCFIAEQCGVFCNFLIELSSTLGSGCVIYSEMRFLEYQVLNVNRIYICKSDF